MAATRNGNGQRRRAAAWTRQRILSTAAAGSAAMLAGACGPLGRDTGAPKVQPATVRYLHVDTGQQVWQEAFGKIFSSFEAKYPMVKLQVEPTQFGQLTEKAIATFVGGDYYDMLYGHYTFIPAFVQADVIQPLDGFLAKDREVSAGDFLPAATERMKGKLYGLAWFTNGKEIWYNADLLAQAGVQTPKQLEKEGKWTWDALLDMAKKLTRAEGDQITQYGFNYPFNSTGWFVHSLWAWGADWFDKGFTKPTIEAAPFVSATQFALDMVTRHRVAGGGNFNQAKLAIMISGSFNVRALEEQVMRQNPFKIEMTMMPKGPGGRAVALANNANYIAKTAKAPDATWLFYKHLISKDVQPQIAMLGGGRYAANKKIKPTTVAAYEDLAVYEASAAISRATPLIAKQADLDKEWTAAWKDMVEGKRGVREALIQTQERAAVLLKEGGCIC